MLLLSYLISFDHQSLGPSHKALVQLYVLHCCHSWQLHLKAMAIVQKRYSLFNHLVVVVHSVYLVAYLPCALHTCTCMCKVYNEQ